MAGPVSCASAFALGHNSWKPAGNPGRLRPEPQSTDTVVPNRPCSLRQSMGPLSGNEAHLFDGLAAAANGNREALMAIGLDAIGIDMHHQSTDLAAGT